MSVNEFEAILDKAEKSMGDPNLIFGFVLIGLEKMPNIRINELLELKKVYDQTNGKLSEVSARGGNALPMMEGASRADRRAMERMNKGQGKRSATKKKKRK